MKTIVIDLEESDFGPGAYAFGWKLEKALGGLRIRAPFVLVWFQTLSGETWGVPASEDIERWGKVSSERLMSRARSVANGIWLMQLTLAVRSLGPCDEARTYRQYEALARKTFGVPARLVVEISHYLEVVWS